MFVPVPALCNPEEKVNMLMKNIPVNVHLLICSMEGGEWN